MVSGDIKRFEVGPHPDLRNGLFCPTEPKRHTEVAASGHTQLICRPTGYAIREVDGDAPRCGETAWIDGEPFMASRIVRSPLPGDARHCVVLEPGRTDLS